MMTMIKQLVYSLAIMASLFLLAFPAKAGQNSPVSNVEATFYELVNIARFHPLMVAEALSLDQVSLFSGISEDSPFWDAHKWSLQFNESLALANSAHAQDMLSNDYFSLVSPGGQGPEQRAADAGYLVVSVYQNMTLLSFQNYLSPEQAALQIFKQFFLDEVESFKDGKLSIFDHGLRDIGLSFQKGQKTLGGKSANVYLFVIQLGISQDTYVEESLARLINSSRVDHSRALDDHGIDKIEAARALGGFLLINLQGGLTPLLFNAPVEDRVWLANQDSPVNSSEVLSIRWAVNVFEDDSEWDIAQQLFSRLISREDLSGVKAIFNPQANSATVNVRRFSEELGNIAEAELTLYFLNPSPNMIMGNVFENLSGDQVYSIEYGLENVRLVSRDIAGKVLHTTMSGPQGSFRVRQFPGSVATLEVWKEEELLFIDNYIPLNRSQWREVIVR